MPKSRKWRKARTIVQTAFNKGVNIFHAINLISQKHNFCIEILLIFIVNRNIVDEIFVSILECLLCMNSKAYLQLCNSCFIKTTGHYLLVEQLMVLVLLEQFLQVLCSLAKFSNQILA